MQYYENDDPTYYRNKIQYTLTQDVTDAGLFYTDSANDVCKITHCHAWLIMNNSYDLLFSCTEC